MTRISPAAFLTSCFALTAPLFAQKPPSSPMPEGPCVPGVANLCIPLDPSFTVVTFDGTLGGSGPANPGDPCQRNDDDTTNAINLQFSFNLYGQVFNQVFINNNGNVSFGQGFSQFTSTGFPVAGFPMVAPFWADVDTRNLTSGVVYFKSELHRFTVIWDHVGYFSAQADKLNTFELIISDGTDALVGLGNNVCFCYGDMQWTTGSASGGSGGFGGSPATVGVNAGNGTDFFQIVLFDQPGVAYDGPGGANDGVDFLDNQAQCFAAGQLGNQPPIFINLPTNCLMASAGVPLNFLVQAIGPEANQTVTITVNSNGLQNFSCVTVPGNPATANCTFIPGGTQVGTFNIVYTACDNFNPPACTTVTLCITVAECHTVLGLAAGNDQVQIFGHLYNTQLFNVTGSYPVTMDNIPSFRVPLPHVGPGGTTYQRVPIFAQVVMYNPQIFPTNPSQWSRTMQVTANADGSLNTDYTGTRNGITIRATTFTDANGVLRMHFPFRIDGM